MSELYHDSRAPLGGPVYRTGWAVGVRVEPVEQTAALGRGADLERSSVELWGKASGRWVREAELDGAIDQTLAATVAELDAALAELWAHRERLAREYLRRTGEGLHCPPGERLLTLLAEAERERDEARAEAARLRAQVVLVRSRFEELMAVSMRPRGLWWDRVVEALKAPADAPTLTPADLAAARAQALRRLNHDEES